MHVLVVVVYPSQAYGVSCLAVMVGGVSPPSVTFFLFAIVFAPGLCSRPYRAVCLNA